MQRTAICYCWTATEPSAMLQLLLKRVQVRVDYVPVSAGLVFMNSNRALMHGRSPVSTDATEQQQRDDALINHTTSTTSRRTNTHSQRCIQVLLGPVPRRFKVKNPKSCISVLRPQLSQAASMRMSFSSSTVRKSA